MKHINNIIESDIFDIDKLDLLTNDEKRFNQNYVKKLQGYSEGKVDGIQIKNLTAGAATIVKRQQSRSAVALLKWNVALRMPEMNFPSDMKKIEEKK